MVDSQSSKNSSTCTKHTGIDRGKLVKERKRFYITDTLGNLLDCFVVSANSYDGTTAAKYWNRMYNDNELSQNIKLVFADGTFGGTFREQMKDRYNIEVEIFKVPIATKCKIQIHKKRRIAEITIAWTFYNRRCYRNYERKIKNSMTFAILTNNKRSIWKI